MRQYNMNMASALDRNRGWRTTSKISFLILKAKEDFSVMVIEERQKQIKNNPKPPSLFGSNIINVPR